MLVTNDFAHMAGPVHNQGSCGASSYFAMADLVGTKAYTYWGGYV